MPAGTEEDPFLHNLGDDRRRKWCQCADCGHKGICTPSSDFYGAVGGGPLRCEACFREWLRLHGLKEMRHGDEQAPGRN